jgi:hypothetical protein
MFLVLLFRATPLAIHGLVTIPDFAVPHHLKNEAAPILLGVVLMIRVARALHLDVGGGRSRKEHFHAVPWYFFLL